MFDTLFTIPMPPNRDLGPLDCILCVFRAIFWLVSVLCRAFIRITIDASQELRPGTTTEQAQTCALLMLAIGCLCIRPLVQKNFYPLMGSITFLGILYYMIHKQMKEPDWEEIKTGRDIGSKMPQALATTPTRKAANTTGGGFWSSFRTSSTPAPATHPSPPLARNSNSSTSLDSMLSSRTGSTMVGSEPSLSYETAMAMLRATQADNQNPSSSGTPALSRGASSHSVASVLRTPAGSPRFPAAATTPPPSSPKTLTSSGSANSSRSTLVRYFDKPSVETDSPPRTLTKKAPASTNSANSSSSTKETLKAIAKAPLYTTPAPAHSLANSATARAAVKKTFVQMAKVQLCAPDPAKVAAKLAKLPPAHSKGECVCNVCIERREERERYMANFRAKEDERKKATRNQMEITWGLGGQQQAW